jgi:hypothetical protein
MLGICGNCGKMPFTHLYLYNLFRIYHELEWLNYSVSHSIKSIDTFSVTAQVTSTEGSKPST